MEQKALFDLYVDYAIGNSGDVTATGLSEVSNGLVSYDQVTRLLNSPQGEFTLASYWKRIKPLISTLAFCKKRTHPGGEPQEIGRLSL